MPPSAPGSSQLAWRILIVTLLASALSNMDQSLFGYAVPGVMADLHVDIAGIGLMISAAFAFAILSAPFLAARVPRWGAPAVLTVSVAASALFVGLQAFAGTATQFAAARIAGFGISAAIIPVSGAYLATHAPDRGRALLIAIQQCGYPLGWFIASLVAAPLLVTHGWRVTFLIAFAVVPLAGLIYWALPREGAARAREHSAANHSGSDRDAAARIDPARARAATSAALAGADDSRARLLFAPALRRLTCTWGAAFFLYGGAIGGTSFYLPTFFQQARGYDMATATRIVGLSYAIGMVGYIGAALVSEHWLSRRATVVLWLLIASVSLLATLWLAHTLAQDMAIFGFTTIFFYGASSIMLTALFEQFPAALRTAAASIAGTACISLGFVVFPLVTAAAVKVVGWPLSFTLVIVPAVFSAALLIMSLPKAALAR